MKPREETRKVPGIIPAVLNSCDDRPMWGLVGCLVHALRIAGCSRRWMETKDFFSYFLFRFICLFSPWSVLRCCSQVTSLQQERCPCQPLSLRSEQPTTLVDGCPLLQS
jgi:hypothetical protein